MNQTADFSAGAVESAAQESKAAPKPEPEEEGTEAPPKPVGQAVRLPKSTIEASGKSRRTRDKSDPDTFKLSATRPSKQRTGGKKGWHCTIL